jgi:hypothetical protein
VVAAVGRSSPPRLSSVSSRGLRFPSPDGPFAGVLVGMPDVTRLPDAAAVGDPAAAADLLPLVYDELRQLAAARLAAEKPDQTLQVTALVHEAYPRLVGAADGPRGTAGATSSPPRPRPCGGS